MCNKWWLQPLTLVATIVEEVKKLAAAFVEEEMSLAATIDDKGAAIDAYKRGVILESKVWENMRMKWRERGEKELLPWAAALQPLQLRE